MYRFEVKVPAGKTATQAVTEEKVINEQVQLTNSNDDQMRFFLNSTDQQPEGQGRPEAGAGPALRAGQDAARSRTSWSGS